MNSFKNQNSAFRNIVVTAASFIIIIAGVMAAKAIIVPVLLALFLSIICTQPILFLKKRKIPYGLAILIVFLSLGFI